MSNHLPQIVQLVQLASHISDVCVCSAEHSCFYVTHGSSMVIILCVLIGYNIIYHLSPSPAWGSEICYSRIHGVLWVATCQNKNAI